MEQYIKALKMVDECLTDGIPIEKNDPVHNKVKEILSAPLATDNTLPPPKPWELQIIKNIWRRAYLDSEEEHVKILKEYGEQIAQQSRQQERQKVITECIDEVIQSCKDEVGDEYRYDWDALSKMITQRLLKK